jgi:phosphoribosylamine--glycine ligase
MLTRSGPKLIEYNARFGDPEAQVLMPRFEGDLVQVMLACATGTLAEVPPPVFSDRPALTVVVAAAGYPAAPRTGGRIDGLAEAEATGALVFQAGTRADGDVLRTSGGRVLAVTALGDSVAAAQAAAYRGVVALAVEGGFHRTDIGWREVERETR